MNYFFNKSRFLILIIVLIMFGCSDFEKQPEKSGIVITSPELAEIIYHLDGLDNIVAVTVECTYPKELSQVHKIGSFGKIDIEKIIQLNPKKVYLSGLEQDGMRSELTKMEIDSETLYINSISDFINTIKILGDQLDRQEEATQLVSEIDSEIRIYAKNKQEKPDVYVEIYGNPLMSVADSSLVGEMVEVAGGNNIFDSLPRAYSRINVEELIEANPDVIIITYPGVTSEDVKNRKGWDRLSAVISDKIYTVDDIDPDLILRATPRMTQGLKKLRGVINE